MYALFIGDWNFIQTKINLSIEYAELQNLFFSASSSIFFKNVLLLNAELCKKKPFIPSHRIGTIFLG